MPPSPPSDTTPDRSAASLPPARPLARLGPVAEGAPLHVTLSGTWVLGGGGADMAPLRALIRDGGVGEIVVGEENLGEWDSALPLWLVQVGDLCRGGDITLDLSALPSGLQKIVALARAVPEQSGTGRDVAPASMAEQVGTLALRFAAETDAQVRFVGEVALSMTRLVRGKARTSWRDFGETLQSSGPSALPIVTVIALLVGLILAFIGAVQLRWFGAELYVANLVGIGMVREMGSVMTGVVIAGRCGAAIAARIGTMQAQEEIDALVTLGISPVEYLVLPRVLGLAVMMPLLYLYACAMGLLGGLLVGAMILHISPLQYIHATQESLSFAQVVIGLGKSLVFGILVAMAGCLRGLQAGRSAASVGQATTEAVVTGITYIIVADAAFALALDVLGW